MLGMYMYMYMKVEITVPPLPRDLGVFIGAMDESGFAAKSQKLKTNDRILACNGVDFTKNPFKK